MNMRVRIELSVMMFLEFFIWGAWVVTMGTYLTEIGFQGSEVGRAYSTTAWAAIVSPLFVGMVADRFFSAEKVLGVMHLLGAVLMYVATRVEDPWIFFWVLLGYALCYMPTLALVNAIAFNQMDDPERQFPSVRVLGTIGWIVAGLILAFSGRIAGIERIDATVIPLQLAAGVSVFMGLYSFFLPRTAPQSAGQKVRVKEVLGLDTLALMKKLSFAVFIISSLLVCIPLAFYYNFTNLFLNESGMKDVVGKMTMGQMSEVFFLLVMPFFFKRLGVKKMLLVGMAAWVARYVLFAFGNNEALVFMFYLGIILHGVCFDFFFVTGQIYVNNEAPPALRSSAQGFLALVTYGVGMVIGANISGLIVQHYEKLDEAGKIVHQWREIWLIPGIMAAVVMVLFALLFRQEPKIESPEVDADETVEL